MRPFSSTELEYCSQTDIVDAVSAMAQTSYDLVQCALGVFEAMDVNLSVRCGMGIGPAFAAVMGTHRVSYDIFGLAPVRARVMETLSPIGHVTVCRLCHYLLRHGSSFVFGDVVFSSGSDDRAACTFESKAKRLLDSMTEGLADTCGRIATVASDDYEFSACEAQLNTLIESVGGAGKGDMSQCPHKGAMPIEGLSIIHMHVFEGAHSTVPGASVDGVVLSQANAVFD
ncbi:hypothetical protein KIPB_009646 [Kipferlia bialata]|uniref:Guanylate cyclase domain-containing protein n=1 Tax=Kipferlia bialata TaxID=797122 RepID=A0A9K3D242_9EUKA|nr:hypothetical protein KIPB_009646 [Kipferlia bialata]|eukprot:g9646.t1